jgi:nucleoside-diphosphate-sugar epimerase
MTTPQTDHQPIDVLVLGSSGRVGRAVLAQFDRSDITTHTIGRYSTADHHRFDAELIAALSNVDVVLNVAGVAHLDSTPSAADLDRLTAANLAMPVLVARRCLENHVPMIHVSSSKADDATTPYGWSKALCDATLDTSFGPAFASAGLPLVILKPPALLIGPFDAGKLRTLRWIDRVPKQLLPQRTMPVLSSTRFVTEVKHWVQHSAQPTGETSPTPGVHTVRWHGADLDTLHAIHDAMRDTRKNRRR